MAKKRKNDCLLGDDNSCVMGSLEIEEIMLFIISDSRSGVESVCLFVATGEVVLRGVGDRSQHCQRVRKRHCAITEMRRCMRPCLHYSYLSIYSQDLFVRRNCVAGVIWGVGISQCSENWLQ